LVCIGLRDVARPDHSGQRTVAGGPGGDDVFPGRRGIRARDHSRQQSALGEIKPVCRAAEEGVGGRLRTVKALAKIDAVEIIAENLFFRVGLLDAMGQKDFEQFSVIGSFQAPDAVASQLLGDRAASLPRAMADEVRHSRACHAEEINGAMRIKAAVLGRDHRLGQELRHRQIGGQRNPVFIEEAAEGVALVIVEDRGFGHLSDHVDIDQSCAGAVIDVEQGEGRMTTMRLPAKSQTPRFFLTLRRRERFGW